MKTLNTSQIQLKAIDIDLKKALQQDLKNYRLTQLKIQTTNQGNKQAA